MPGSGVRRPTPTRQSPGERSTAAVRLIVTETTAGPADHDAAGRRRSAVGAAALLALVWLVVASINPETTYHLAPPLVAAVPAVMAPAPIGAVAGLRLGAVGLVVAVAIGVVLFLGPGLEGPSLRPFTSAAQETFVLTAVGALVGSAVAIGRSIRSDRRPQPASRRRRP